ncbi:hypothetical protein A2625_01065 [candidate division WOR-1 bacterium RIFCSPHIGHO2_01_FULL_53_15]|uniref:HTH cro/C1-type domain-containing protein n=1 Tax=candidate division WOR-1 bacterium RIFCSPHIGHO2_01_FULL_53_15 TaxID=1802564 RepID=A0A1F4Q0N4_UNCSA|nr:MAG: hypothetical protein A2625_01065 [candidate division WOR-1 bacterium RIFCSPHIGHO2_01_FULL_53_15]OGC10738.1 MAG: hypothetical protein A3D23_04575 [candidate division WOR-1 bacterium RIFCSPHIGHO2_02_FULL_53_26]
MSYKKYFWGLKPQALRETGRILKSPDRPKFIERIFVLLSRCDSPKELFSLISRKQFVAVWPKIRRYWLKKDQAPDFRAWWETVYEQLAGREQPRGKNFERVGKLIREKRLELGLSQADLARRAGMKQPDISTIELGAKNITLETLVRLGRILGIKNLPII